MLAVSTRRVLVKAVAHLLLVRSLISAKARSGFFELFDTAKPWLVGVDQSLGVSIAPSVSGLIHLPWPLTKKYEAEWACSMPTVPEAKAPLGSTQRPVQAILLMPPLSVASF